MKTGPELVVYQPSVDSLVWDALTIIAQQRGRPVAREARKYLAQQAQYRSSIRETPWVGEKKMVTLRLLEDQWESLIQQAARHGMTLAEFVSCALYTKIKPAIDASDAERTPAGKASRRSRRESLSAFR